MQKFTPTSQDFDWQNLTLPSSPNYFLLIPSTTINLIKGQFSYIPSRIQVSPQFNCSVDKLQQLCLKHITNQARTTLYRGDNNVQTHYIQRSLFFRFPDIISIEIQAVNQDTATLFLYSRSVYGYSDFGVNKRRVKNLVKELNKEIISR
ncbi:DUF1499 domain-containing protein [Piscirickettsia salmonis]|uniref:DUF1499 domain-containing protein n=1 Tax=Piscirickettsia salmonis TaxID=1238 RepID=UPI0007C89DA7|nr:hypothetical protein A0O36_02225 [Piscirickettsiaceae bacterium NZ-RLO1]